MAGPRKKVTKALSFLDSGYSWKSASEKSGVPMKHIYKLLTLRGLRKK